MSHAETNMLTIEQAIGVDICVFDLISYMSYRICFEEYRYSSTCFWHCVSLLPGRPLYQILVCRCSEKVHAR